MKRFTTERQAVENRLKSGDITLLFTTTLFDKKTITTVHRANCMRTAASLRLSTEQRRQKAQRHFERLTCTGSKIKTFEERCLYFEEKR